MKKSGPTKRNDEPCALPKPVRGNVCADQIRLKRLVQAGLVRPGRCALSGSLFTTSLPKPSGAPAVAALIEERREGR